jgi:ankyrin repeat protein
MNENKLRSIDKITAQHIASIKQEIARHPRILDEAIRKNDATKLKKAYIPLIRLHRKIKTEINTGLLEDSSELQEILTISRQQINNLQAFSRLKPLNIESILDSFVVKAESTQPASYSSVVSQDIQLNLLEYSNLDSIVSLACTNTRLWDLLNSKKVVYIWKALAGIYFNRNSQKDTIDSMKKLKRAFYEHYEWRYVLPNDYFDTRPNYKERSCYYKIKRKGLLFRKAVEGGLMPAVESKEFKENLKTGYTDPLALYLNDDKAEGRLLLFSDHLFLDPQLDKPFNWQDFLDPLFCLKIDLSGCNHQGLLYEIQSLYEKTHKQKYKEELDYIFNLAIEESGINLEAIITQFSQGLILRSQQQLRGTVQERAQFFYVVYLTMRCYQTKVIDQLLANGFGVNGDVVFHVASTWKLIDQRGFISPRKHLRIMNMLDMAIETRSFKMIDYLISKGIDINATAELGFTSLALEVQKIKDGDRNLTDITDTTILRFLLERPGVKPDLPSHETGITPLHIAVGLGGYPSYISGKCQIVQLLISHRADVNLRLESKSGYLPQAHGRTPLHCTQHYAVAEMLINNKADVNAEYDVGLTPLYSMIRGAIERLEKQEDPQVSIDIARLLCQFGADVSKQLSDGRTLLQMTADAAHQMRGRTAKQKLKELLTVLQTTKPVQKKMEKEISTSETKMISPRGSWLSIFSSTPEITIPKPEEKVQTGGKKKQPEQENMNNSFS